MRTIVPAIAGAAGWLMIAVMALVSVATAGEANTVTADPLTYAALVSRLQPGDTLVLAAGTYRDGLRLRGLHGTPDAPIVIRGPASGPPARFVARAGANTVSIRNASHLVIESLLIDGNGVPVDAVKAEGGAGFAHHITLTNLTIVNHGAGQQNVAISTKCPAWNWIIRGNHIVGAGTGIYLGDSDGSAPFVGGIIEQNVITDTLGYNLQIKHQRSRPQLPGMPSGKSTTVIRGNAFHKGPRSSVGELARPNVLVGHFPLTGAGAADEYAIYGNLFLDNPTEMLLQAEGNVAIYNNVFVNRAGSAISIQPHKHLPRQVLVFHNTVVAAKGGIALRGGEPGYVQRVEGNVILADEPLSGADSSRNLAAAFGVAATWLVHWDPVGARLHPALRPERAPRAIVVAHHDLPDADRDFFGAARTTPVPGAVAGTGAEIALEALSVTWSRGPSAGGAPSVQP